MNETIEFSLDIPSNFEGAAGAALIRAAYLFPDITFEQIGGRIHVRGARAKDESEIRKEVLYLIYRERIRADFEPFRRKALERIYGPSQ